MCAGNAGALHRVWAWLPAGTAEAIDRLSATDLQTLLMSVARSRAARVRPPELLRRWREDRFVRPSTSRPRELSMVEGELWRMLPPEVDDVELSPLAPLGTCSAVGPVSQNRTVTTMRTAEVVSDSTNALAIEAAARRRSGAAGPVHLAASHRQLRAQTFGPGYSAHFRLFTMVSSARDSGSAATEAGLLVTHLRYWQRVLAALAATASPRLLFTVFDAPVLRERMLDSVLPALAAHGDEAAAVPVIEEPDRVRGRGYYAGLAMRSTLFDGADEVDLGDGGFTTWTAQILGDAKERCLTSCVSIERLTATVRADPQRRTPT
jgi:hypothetical protein